MSIQKFLIMLLAPLAVPIAIIESPVYSQQLPTIDGGQTDSTKILGAWEGALDVGAIRLRLVFNIRSEAEKLQATLDSPDQGAKNIPLDQVKLDGSEITISSKKMGAAFVGKLNSTNDAIDGKWTQGGREFPLKLKRAVGTTERRRPQTPKGPYSYRNEEIGYAHLSNKFQFAATLTIPQGTGPFSAAVLISGSGAQDRDESIFEHKPFAVLADHLTKAGMIVLRVDDRGVGGTGNDENPSDDTTADFATDAKSAIAYLKTRREVDQYKIGLIGHSEGAIVGSMVAAEDHELAFLVLLAGPGVPGDELLVLQSEKIARASGASDAGIKDLRAMQQAIFSIIRNQTDVDAGRKEARAHLLAEYEKATDAEKKAAGSADAFADQHSAVVSIPWFRYFITLDPRNFLKKVACPVLALTGDKDLQVPPEQNLPEIERAAQSGGNKEVMVKSMPGLNHLFQTAKTGLVTEYGEIEETIAPTALNEISTWLKGRKFLE
ncbi:MAG: alpha/beta hydrolase [Pirellula sp.]